MAKPKKRKYNKRNKGKIKIRKSVRVRKKSEHPKGNGVKPTRTIQNDNGTVFKIKIRKKE